MRRLGPALLLVLWLATSLPGQAPTLPITVSLEEVVIKDAPALQSYSAAVTPQGRWLLVGGRTSGMHGNQDTGSTPKPITNFENFHRNLVVIDPVGKTVASRPIDELVSKPLAASLMVTNAQSVQVGDKLVIIGGYGFDRTGRFLMTHPTLTIIDVEATCKAVVDHQPIDNHIRQAALDEALRVTGGELAYLDGQYYLVFGQSFTSAYTQSSNGIYTYESRAFKLIDSNGQVSFQKTAKLGSNTVDSFRRRDGNLVPMIGPDGKSGLVYYGGVFTSQKGPWLQPVEVRADRMTLDETGFKQCMCHYECPVLPLYDPSTGRMTTVFFGGISQTVHTAAGFKVDAKMPFVNSITAIVRDRQGHSREWLVCQGQQAQAVPLELPGLLGASAGFLPSPAAPFDDGVLRLDRLDGETVVGHIYGGLAASQPNGGTSTASARVFAVRVKRSPSPAIPVEPGS